MKQLKLMLSVLWFIIAVGVYVYITNIIEYPIIDSFEDMFGVVFIFLLPIFFMLYFGLSKEKREKFIGISFVSIMVASVIYFCVSCKITAFYPIKVSETRDYNNYLCFDDVSDNIDKLKYIFPKEIPEKATEISYFYKAFPYKNAMMVEAYWVLTSNEYDAEESRIQAVSKMKLQYDSLTYYYIDVGEEYCHICFDEEEKSVSYFAEINNCCDWQNISWIKGEFRREQNTGDGTVC